MKLLAAAILALSISACGSQFERDAINSARQEMADPDAAKFRRVRTVDGNKLCAEVNAKNAFGGYTGWQPILVVGAGKNALVYAPNLPQWDAQTHRLVCE